MPTVITPGAGYLTDISGVGEVTADKLTSGGITTIAELAAASPEHVAEILGYSSTTKATAFIDEAKSLIGI
jgi:predicted flap endonuclease-1-like 5' DNA nuclease